MSQYVSYLEGAIDGTRLPAGQVHTLHEGRPIWVHYDLERVAQKVDRDAIGQDGDTSLWRYHALLPLPESGKRISLGEGMSPLLRCERLGQALGLNQLYVKDESQMPTGSFKDRGQTVAISMAKHFGIDAVAIPTAGNAGGSMAAYAARAGMQAYVFMPHDTPIINQYETVQAGAHAYLVNGLINDCGRIVLEGKTHKGWFDLSTLKEPYRIEGKKTMGLELAEQFGWSLPDVILYPTGGGTGLIGMWKAFAELVSLGWLEREQLPRMVAVQAEGCAPIVTAWDRGERFAEPFENAQTVAAGLRVPVAVGDFMILDAVRASGGCAVAVAEERIKPWMKRGAALEGISIGPESATCLAAADMLRQQQWLGANERVVAFNCGDARKYPALLHAELPQIDITEPLEWDAIG